MMTPEQMLDPAAWSFEEACKHVDGRDRDRSAMSDVPKQSSPIGGYSHHHRLLLSRGGDDSPANLVLVLGSGSVGEHWWIHQHPEWATVLGYMVPTGQDPARVPIWRMDAFGTRWGWYLQTVDGQLEPTAPPRASAESDTATLIEALAAFEEIVLAHRRGAVRHL